MEGLRPLHLCYNDRMAVTKTIFNTYASNIADDGAIAIFDVLPSDDIAQSDGLGEYVNAFASVDEITWLDQDFRFFPIKSSHTPHISTAYYLNRRTNRYADFPDVRGVPMNYGGAPRARYKALSTDLVGSEPLLVLPSYGIGWDYSDRAKSFEMWINTEPYVEAASYNIFPDSIYQLDEATETSEGFVATGNYNEIVTDSYVGRSPLANSWMLDDGAKFVFSEQILLSGNLDYKFFVAVKSDTPDAIVTVSFTTDVKDYVFNIPVPITAQFDTTFSGDFYSNWGMVSVPVNIDGTIDSISADVSISVSGGDVGISSPLLYSTFNNLVASMVQEQTVVEFGGLNGTNVKLTADDNFLHLYGYGNSDSYQVGEWARPLYLVFIDNETNFEVYLDCEKILEVEKTSNQTYGVVLGEWIQISISESFKYIDLSTLAIYSKVLNTDIQKIHMLFGYGPSYHDTINITQNDGVYVADGSQTTFASSWMFPLTTPFSTGEYHGLNTSDALVFPEYELPTLVGFDEEQIEYLTDAYTIGYPLESFRIPTDGEMQLGVVDVDTDIAYIALGVLPQASIVSGTVCSLYSKSLGYSLEVEFTTNEDGTINLRLISSWSSQPTTYDAYESLYTTYELDPNYQKTSYAQLAGTGVPWYDEAFVRGGTLLLFNINKMRQVDDPDIAALFSDNDLVLRINDSTYFTHVALGTESSVRSGGLLHEGEDDLPAFSVELADDNGLYPRRIIGNFTYVLYAHNNALDIASVGTWNVSIPLTNFASFVEGKPDLDFIIYSDNRQSPQLVSSLTTDVATYHELEAIVHGELSGQVADNEGSYADLQYYAENPEDLQYRQVGINVDTSVPVFGRFANPAIETFVTLDSLVRWPDKTIGSLAIERATTNDFIDFEDSPNSVMDTKWEIFDGWAIRIPKNINLYLYQLGFEVRLVTRSIKDRRPSFRRADFFGIASGDSPSNQINIGSNNVIVVGNADDINIYNKFSTHLPTESLQTTLLTRELGFYPHAGAPVNMYLGNTDSVQGISFYVNWRAETFRTTDPYIETLATFHYVYDDGNVVSLEQLVIDLTTQTPSITPNFANLSITSNNGESSTIYVDGEAGTLIEAGRWHFVYIDLTNNVTFNTNRSTRFTLYNNKGVVNYVTSHSIPIDASNLFSSRFGIIDHEAFNDDFSASLHFGTAEGSYFPSTLDDASVLSYKRVDDGGFSESPDKVIEVTLGNSSVV